MKKNKIVAAIAVSTFMISMGAVAAETDDFIASFSKVDEITINGLQDVELTNSSSETDDGAVIGRTPFCVGRTGAATGGDGKYRVTVSTTNAAVGNIYQLTQGDSSIDYALYFTAIDTFDKTKEIRANDPTIDGTTVFSAAQCDVAGEGTGYMWVSVPAASRSEAGAGTYTDVVTMLVAPRS